MPPRTTNCSTASQTSAHAWASSLNSSMPQSRPSGGGRCTRRAACRRVCRPGLVGSLACGLTSHLCQGFSRVSSPPGGPCARPARHGSVGVDLVGPPRPGRDHVVGRSRVGETTGPRCADSAGTPALASGGSGARTTSVSTQSFGVLNDIGGDLGWLLRLQHGSRRPR